MVKVGEECFYKGKHYIVAGEANNTHMYIHPKNSVGCFTAYCAPKLELEPIASEVFAIGQSVRSNHSFRGKVTGFEHEENRVVCISDKAEYYNDNRTRFSYKVEDLCAVKRIEFQMNRKYLIQMVGAFHTEVIALPYPKDHKRTILYSITTGNIVTTLPRLLDDVILRQHNVCHFELL